MSGAAGQESREGGFGSPGEVRLTKIATLVGTLALPSSLT